MNKSLIGISILLAGTIARPLRRLAAAAPRHLRALPCAASLPYPARERSRAPRHRRRHCRRHTVAPNGATCA